MLLAGAALLVSSACATGDSAAPTSDTDTTTALSDPCVGIGPAPELAEVTWLADGRLMAATAGGPARCLLEVGQAETLEWAGSADRVLLGSTRAVTAEGEVSLALPSNGRVRWSAPTGKSVLHVDAQGRLRKQVLGGAVSELAAMERADDAVYHPAGLTIAASGEGEVAGGEVVRGLFVARNTGEGAPQPLAEGETARRIDSLAFSSDGALVFVADHGGHSDLHRLDLQRGTMATVATVSGQEHIGRVAVSPFETDAVAFARCQPDGATRPTFAERGGSALALEGTSVARAEPIGWLPDGGLVLVARPRCDDGPGSLYVFRDGTAHLVAEDVEAAAVRAVLPEPPPSPEILPTSPFA